MDSFLLIQSGSPQKTTYDYGLGYTYSFGNTTIYSSVEKEGDHILSGYNTGNKDHCYGWDISIQHEYIDITNDHIGLYELFHYRSDDLTVVSTNISEIIKVLRSNDITPSINLDSIRSLLTFGYHIGHLTPITSIDRLAPSSRLRIYSSDNQVAITRSDFIQETLHISTIDQFTDAFATYFKEAVSLQLNRDQSLDNRSTFFLSGGLDSRATYLTAKELEASPTTTLTVSDANYYELDIARSIAEQSDHYEHLIDGNYLSRHIDHIISQNEGMTIFFGAAHIFDAITSKQRLFKTDTIHSGSIGDFIFGSYSDGKSITDMLPRLVYTNDPLMDDISILDQLMTDYDGNTERFNLEQRMINGTISGDRLLQPFFHVISPFYHRKILSLFLQTPVDLKQKYSAYYDWMNRYLPSMQRWVWERTNQHPIPKHHASLLSRFHLLNIKLRKMLRRPGYSMNPFEYWFKSNQTLSNQFDTLYREGLGKLSDGHPVKEILLSYDVSTVRRKMHAVHVLKTTQYYSDLINSPE